METWYRIHFTQEQVAQDAGKNLMHQFAGCQSRPSVSAGLVLFEEKRRDYLFDSSDTSDEVDLSETYFLPPPAALHCPQLLKRYSAEPCDKPDPSTVKAVDRDSDFNFWFS
ncbi:MAG: hypothetical protein LC803_13950 [Acidobacteria bacterium]|nr:hypothetical protein [Acidobacteriota bacterium]